MSDFDLVPSDYRKSKKIRSQIQLFIAVYLLVVVLIAGARWLVYDKASLVEKKVMQQQLDKQTFLQEQQRYNQLHGNITTLQRQLEVLAGLRAGPPAIAIFEMLDRVVGNNIWIDSWDFVRAGEWAEPEPESVNMGYLIVIPEGRTAQDKQAWRLNTHMSLSGQAMDHSSLAQFVQRLLQQAEIEDVVVQKTGLTQYKTISVVDFSLAIIVNNQAKVAR